MHAVTISLEFAFENNFHVGKNGYDECYGIIRSCERVVRAFIMFYNSDEREWRANAIWLWIFRARTHTITHIYSNKMLNRGAQKYIHFAEI